MSARSVKIRLHVNEEGLIGQAFQITPVPENIAGLKEAVYKKKKKFLCHCDADDLLVYNHDTELPIQEGVDALDPFDDHIPDTDPSPDSTKHRPLIVVAYASKEQEGETRRMQVETGEPSDMEITIDSQNIPGSSQLLCVSSDSQSTAITEAPTATPPATPIQQETLADFFNRNKYSPPSKSEDAVLDKIIVIAETILSERDWNSLELDKKVQLAFLIFKNQIEWVRQNYPNNWDKKMMEAMQSGSVMNNAIQSFIRPGGDRKSPDSGHYQLFLRKSDTQWCDTDTDNGIFSIFAYTNDFKNQLLPFVRLQTIESIVCWCLSACNAILYFMQITTGTNHEEAIRQYGINLGRFMRNNFTEEEIFRTIFNQNGGYPQDFLERLLSSNTVTGKVMPVDIFMAGGPAYVFTHVVLLLKKSGSIVVSNFRVFPGYYENLEQTQFCGDWNDLKGLNENGHHSFLITGVHKTTDGSCGGIIFQVQDTLPGRPFVNIGLDLLHSMNVTYNRINETCDVVFKGTSNENCFDDLDLYATPTSGSVSLKSAEPLEFAATLSTLTTLSSEELAQSGNVIKDEDTNRLPWVKPDWLGFDIPEGTDVSKLVFHT